MTADDVKARGYNLDIKNPHTVADDHGDPVELLAKLDGRLSDADREYIEGAFRLLTQRILHGPISALTEETHAESATGGHTLLDAMRKLFRLEG